MATIVSIAAKAAKESTPKGDTITVKVLDTILVPNPDVKHGQETFEAGDVVELPALYAERHIRVGSAEKP